MSDELIKALLNAFDAEHETKLGESRTENFLRVLKEGGYVVVKIQKDTLDAK